MSGRAYWKTFLVVHALTLVSVAAVWLYMVLETGQWRVFPALLMWLWVSGSGIGLLAYWRGVGDERRQSGARRNHLAWQNARERAQNHLDALIESDEECAALRAELRARDEALR